MNAPQNLAVDYAGNVYVADLYNNLVRVVSYATQDMSTVAGKNPSSSCAGENSDPTTMCLNFPVGVAVDSNFNIYIAEAGGNQIKYVDVANNVMYTIIGSLWKLDLKFSNSLMVSHYVGTGAAGYTGDGGIGLSATLNQPAGLAVDLSLHLYICDNGNNVVRKFYPSGGGGTILTIIGTSAGSGYTADGADAASTQISFPYGIVVDNSGTYNILRCCNPRLLYIFVCEIFQQISISPTRVTMWSVWWMHPPMKYPLMRAMSSTRQLTTAIIWLLPRPTLTHPMASRWMHQEPSYLLNTIILWCGI